MVGVRWVNPIRVRDKVVGPVFKGSGLGLPEDARSCDLLSSRQVPRDYSMSRVFAKC